MVSDHAPSDDRQVAAVNVPPQYTLLNAATVSYTSHDSKQGRSSIAYEIKLLMIAYTTVVYCI